MNLFLVQHESIPQAILGTDIVCQAKSGMGKTAVFVLATLQQLEPVDGQVRIRIIHCKFKEENYQYDFFRCLSLFCVIQENWLFK